MSLTLQFCAHMTRFAAACRAKANAKKGEKKKKKKPSDQWLDGVILAPVQARTLLGHFSRLFATTWVLWLNNITLC